MKYLQKSFSTGANSQAYRDNFDAVFVKPKRGCIFCDEESCEDFDPDDNGDCRCGHLYAFHESEGSE